MVHKNGWIAVDKELPNDKSEVIVSALEYACGEYVSRVTSAYWANGEWRDPDTHRMIDFGPVLAWQPLPEPYIQSTKEKEKP